MPDDLAPTSAPNPTRSAADPGATTGGEPVSPGPAPPPPPGSRYVLGDELARGGMGVVYRATDTAFDREVAVKVLQDRYGPASGAARRFADEARITGQLQHPAIPPVHDFGTLPDGRPFLAMKLIRGRTLEELLAARPVPSADRGRFVAAFEQVCQAVAYAHDHQVIHRDLKPANVMVGSYGEVQVMDWGLAKVLGERPGASGPSDHETAAGTAIQSLRDSDGSFTQAGSVLGTPAFMPPEQAIGAIDQIDARSDVFGLGGILCAVLTGHPPFLGETAESTRQAAAKGKVADAFARLDACGADPDLVALAKRCLAPEKDDRPGHAAEVAIAVAALRAAADERARRAELDRATAEAEAREQRKRRRVQLALAAAVGLLLFGAGAVAWWQDRQATARQQERDRDEELALQRQWDAKAAALVQALATAEPGAVPVLLKELAEYRDEARPYLIDAAKRPGGDRAGLHARLALLADLTANPAAVDPSFLPLLVSDAAECRADELPLLLDRLDGKVRDILLNGFWRLLSSGPEPVTFDHPLTFRFAAVLARLEPDDHRWTPLIDRAADRLVRLNPLEAEPYAEALRPVRHRLVGPLMKRYAESLRRLEAGKLATPELVAEASAFDLTANLLSRYADRAADLADLAVTADPRHYPLFRDAIRNNKAAVIPLLRAELGRSALPAWACTGELGPALAALTGSAPLTDVLDADARIDSVARRHGNAAAALVTLGEAGSVWPLFAFPTNGDPSARSYLTARLAAIGADPLTLMRRFEAEADTSAKRALLIALGDFPPDFVSNGEWGPFVVRLRALYRCDPDSGLHSAIDWLLRKNWWNTNEVAAIDAELATATRLRVLARGLAGACGPLSLGPLLPAPEVANGKDWFVNGEGQTFAVVRGPVEFTLGSPATEPGRVAANEPPHPKRISRSFAIAAKELTVGEFLRFRPDHEWARRYSPGPDTPVVAVSWYDCAAYCNWLSSRDGIPPDQWCYEPNRDGKYAEGMRVKAGHLSLAGYRLPTEAEWEYTCRAGTRSGRFFGRGGDLARYAWFAKTSDDRARPVGGLPPNDRGLFDPLGNVWEWCGSPDAEYQTVQREDVEDPLAAVIDERTARVVRGGSFIDLAEYLRCANRIGNRPGWRDSYNGFRPAKTLPR